MNNIVGPGLLSTNHYRHYRNAASSFINNRGVFLSSYISVLLCYVFINAKQSTRYIHNIRDNCPCTLSSITIGESNLALEVGRTVTAIMESSQWNLPGILNKVWVLMITNLFHVYKSFLYDEVSNPTLHLQLYISLCPQRTNSAYIES